MAQDPVTWRDAPDLAALAAPIIRAHHPHLLTFPVRFVWRSRARKIGKRKSGDPLGAAGPAEVISERFAFFVMTEEEKALAAQAGAPGKMFWIEISEDVWGDLTEPQRLAVLDHELCHCGIAFPEERDGADAFIVYHDHTLFTDEIRRHSLWHVGLEELAAAMLGYEGT